MTWTRQRTCLCLAVLLGLAILTGCGSEDASSRDPEVIDWRVADIVDADTVRIVGEVGHCVGQPEPTIGTPEIAYDGRRVYITATVDASSDAALGEDEVCAGVELVVYRRLDLRRDLSELKLFDAGSDPPEQRWPIP